MNISENGINLIKSFEGCILQSYDDSNERKVNANDEVYGTLTIGWGTTREDYPSLYKGEIISQEKADELFLVSIQKYINDVNSLGRNFTQNEFDALVSFHYNTGSVFTLCRNRNNSEIADAMLLYVKGKINGELVTMEGLVKRRNAERQLFLSGESIPFNQNVSRETSNDYEEHGSAEILCDVLNVRDKPSLSGNVVAKYYKGETISNYFHVYDCDGYRWIEYTGNSGNSRFVAVRDLSDNHRLAKCY